MAESIAVNLLAKRSLVHVITSCQRMSKVTTFLVPYRFHFVYRPAFESTGRFNHHQPKGFEYALEALAVKWLAHQINTGQPVLASANVNGQRENPSACPSHTSSRPRGFYQYPAALFVPITSPQCRHLQPCTISSRYVTHAVGTLDQGEF